MSDFDGIKATGAFVAHQVGAFALIFALMWLAVHFLMLDPELLYAFPAIYFLYLGVSLLRRRRHGRRVPIARP